MVLHNSPTAMIPGIKALSSIVTLGVEDTEDILEVLGVSKAKDLEDVMDGIPAKEIGNLLASLHLNGAGKTAVVVGNEYRFNRKASDSLKTALAMGRLPIVHEELLLTSKTLQISSMATIGGGVYDAADMDSLEEFFDVELDFNVQRDEDDGAIILPARFAAKPGRILVTDDGGVQINGMSIKDTALIWKNSGDRFHPLAQKVIGIATPVDVLRILMVVLKAAYEENRTQKQLLGYLAAMASASAPGAHELEKLDERGIRYRTTNVMGVLVLRTRPSTHTVYAQPNTVDLLEASKEAMLVDPYSVYTVTEKGEDLVRFTLDELLSGDNAWGIKLVPPTI